MKPHIYRSNGMWTVRFYGSYNHDVASIEQWIRDVLMARRG